MFGRMCFCLKMSFNFPLIVCFLPKLCEATPNIKIKKFGAKAHVNLVLLANFVLLVAFFSYN